MKKIQNKTLGIIGWKKLKNYTNMQRYWFK